MKSNNSVRANLALGGGLAAHCDLLQVVKTVEVFGWREESWDLVVGGGGAPGLVAPLLPTSRCLWLVRGGGGVVPERLGRRGEDPWRK